MLLKIVQQYMKKQETAEHPQSIIIYTHTRVETENIAKILEQNQLSAFYFHANVPADQKASMMESWAEDKIRIMVATIAFGMGVDKGSVGLVIHYVLPKSMESLYQESGRAGRNGQQAYSIVLVDSQDINSRTTENGKLDTYDQYSYHCLLKFLYCNSCRRKQLLSYFNSGLPIEKQQNCCDYCDQKHEFSNLFGHQTGFESVMEGINTYIYHLEKSLQGSRKPLISLTDQPHEEPQQEEPASDPDPKVPKILGSREEIIYNSKK